jgi:dihydropteroate synthase
MSPPPRLTLRGRDFDWGARTYVMGIINLTTDSFSGDGLIAGGGDAAIEAAVQQGVAMAAAGADLLDLGGESTRPGFEPVSPQAELARIVPAVERLLAETELPISVDTTKAVVACAALGAGASLINDVNGLRADPALGAVVAEHEATIVVMHNQRNWTPRESQSDVIGDVCDGLEAGMAAATTAGIPQERIIVDPGFGFGWRVEQTLELLRRLRELRELGRPILIGTSRKSSIGRVLDLPVEQRLEGTAATVALAIGNGADIVRVHDVREMSRVARMTDAVVRGAGPSGTLMDTMRDEGDD